MKLPPATTVDLLRHGEPAGGRKFRGSIDDPLSELGWEQMRAAAQAADAAGDATWDQVISSPLLRSGEFAAELAAERKLPIAVWPDVREMHFGEWEGRPTAELWKEVPHQMLPFFKDPENNPPPGGETLQAFQTRLMACWEKLMTEHQGQHILLVCHGGVIRMLLSQVLGLPLSHFSRFDVPYACRSRLRVFHDGENGKRLPMLMSHIPGPMDASGS